VNTKKFLLSILLFPIMPAMFDLSICGSSEQKFDRDAFVRSMNSYMPLQDEILQIGVNGFFGGYRDFTVLENLGREVHGVEAARRDEHLGSIMRRADRIACNHGLHLMVVDVFGVYPGSGRNPIDCVFTLSVAPEDGKIALVYFDDSCYYTSDFVDVPGRLDGIDQKYPGFDQYLDVRVLGHAFTA
jgi:hypothetical protein